jgi:cholesterol transport system auxiliary component
LIGLLACLAAGCSSWLPQALPPEAVYTLDAGPTPPPLASPDAGRPGVCVGVGVPQALAGFDSAAMVYQREPHRIEQFANSRWAAPPARMLGPLIAQALGASATVKVALSSMAGAGCELRLDTQVLRLAQDFSTQPSQAIFVLHAVLLDTRTGRPLAAQDFTASVPAPGDNARSGVMAANQAVQQVLQALSRFVEQAALRRQAQTAVPPLPGPGR